VEISFQFRWICLRLSFPSFNFRNLDFAAGDLRLDIFFLGMSVLNYTFWGSILSFVMPARRKAPARRKVSPIGPEPVGVTPVVQDTMGVKKDALEGDKLDPGEEKVLDWILKIIVFFVLGWLALGVLMAIGGLFGIWK